jgi:hypothetical protein
MIFVVVVIIKPVISLVKWSSSWSNTPCILKDGKLLNVQAQDMDARKKDVIPDKEATEGSIMSDNNMVLLLLLLLLLLLHGHAIIVKQGFV